MIARINRLFFHSEFVTKTSLKDFQKLITDHIEVGVWLISPEDYSVTYDNNKGKHILIDSDNESIGKVIKDQSLHIEGRERNNTTIELLTKDTNNSNRYFISSVSNFIYKGTKSLIITFTDVTAIKLMQLSMKRMSDMKDAVIASVSHDIRTPLNSSIAMNEAALNESTDPRVRMKISISLKSSKLLLYLIADFLDYYKANNTQLRATFSKIRLKIIINEVIELFYIMIKSRGLAFHLEILLEANIEFETDELKLKRILINLLSNAIKFTQKGSITLRAEAASEGGITYICFTVKDTGIGIKPENLEKVFTKFEQVFDESNEENHLYQHGIGLGLSISQEIVKTLSPNPPFNKIFLESEFGVGSAFYFYLPLPECNNIFQGLIRFQDTVASPLFRRQRVNSDDLTSNYLDKNMSKEFIDFIESISNESFSSEKSLEDFKGGIMVVEDEETNIMVMKMYLDGLKEKVVYLRNGKEAVDFFAKCISMKIEVSLILMDLNMPIMNGKIATREIRKLEFENFLRPTQIIALSANIIAVDRNSLNQLGFNGAELKPISHAKVLEIIKDHTRIGQ